MAELKRREASSDMDYVSNSKALHCDLLVELLGMIDPELAGYNQIMIRCSIYMTRVEVEQCKQHGFTEVCDILERRGKFGVGNYGTLRQILKDINEPAIKVIDKYERDIDALALQPMEIGVLDEGMMHTYINALKKGSSKIHRMRLMILGQYNVGKTTLTNGILQRRQIYGKRKSTDGVDIYIGRCQVDLETRKWIPTEVSTEEEDIYERLAEFLNKKNTSEDPTIIEETKEENAEKESYYTEEKNTDFIKTTIYSEPPKNKKKLSSGFKNRKPSLRHLLEKASKLQGKEVGKKRATVDLWDFGGQSVYYHTHQTFLSWRCIYVIVFDASKVVKDYVNDDVHICFLERVREDILFWVNSIFIYARARQPEFPKIFIVGTHFDEIPKAQRDNYVRKLFSEIEKCFNCHPAGKHLIINPKFCFNALDLGESAYTEMKDEFLKIAESHHTWGEVIPTAWIPLEAFLMKLKQEDVKILSLEDIQTMNELDPNQSLTPAELELFLQFHHSLGHILYFAENPFREHIIIDSKYLVDALRTVITAEEFCKYDETKHQMWNKLSEEGVLRRELVHKLWQTQEFARFEDHLLNVMEKLSIIAKPKLYSDDGNEVISDDFFVPCMKTEMIPTTRAKKLTNNKECLEFVVSFNHEFQPESIFQKLVAKCLAMWPVLKVEEQNAIFSDFVGVHLDDFRTLLIQKKHTNIHVFLSFGENINKIGNESCVRIKQFVTNCLQRIIQLIGHVEKTPRGQENKIYTVLAPCCMEHEGCLQIVDAKTKMCDHNCENNNFKCWITYLLEKSEIIYTRCRSFQCKGPSESMMSAIPNEQDFGRISRRLKTTTTPKGLSEALNLESHILPSINFEMSGRLIDICIALLLEWRKQADRDKDKFQDLWHALENEISNIHVLCQVFTGRELKQSIEGNKLGIAESKLVSEPTDKELNQVADNISMTEGFQLCIELGVTYVELNHEKCATYCAGTEEIRAGLKLWKRNCKKKQKRNAKVEELVSAFAEIKADKKILENVFGNIAMIQDTGAFTSAVVPGHEKVPENTQSALITVAIAKCTKSVGCIVSPEMTGTGFRVGNKYLMTCWHVIEPIISDTTTENEKDKKIFNFCKLSREEVYVQFQYIYDDGGKQEDQFRFTEDVPYYSHNLDVAILELKEERALPLPVQVTKFDYPNSENEVYFVGHPAGRKMRIDHKVKIFERNDDIMKEIIEKNEWCYDQFKVRAYKTLYDENKIIFDCRFKEGASGSPGMIVDDNSDDPVVVVMLQGGVPNMKNPILVWHANSFPDKYLKEYGVGMNTIYLDMKKTPDHDKLRLEIFGKKRFVTQ